MAQVTRADILHVYRYLLRSIRIAFHGDSVVLNAARKEARRRFDEGRNLTAGTDQAVEGIEEARNVSKFLRRNLVQGIKEDKDDYYSKTLFGRSNDRITNTRGNREGR